MSNSGPDNFGTILRSWADTRSDRLAFRFLIDGETEGPGWTYAELDCHARRIAGALLQHASPGDRALLLYPPGLEFVGALFGCLQAGTIAIPAYPPRLERIAHSRQLLANLAQDCVPSIVLTGTPSAGSMRGACSGIPQLDVPWLNTDLLAGPELHAGQVAPQLDALALLQYTSGSTGDPKGVMITHRNLLHNERMIEAAFEHRPGIDSGLGVCWLPPYHDMGLIGNILHAVFIGATSVLLPPLAIVQRPARWLQAISHYRADTSGGPNFAYEMCVTRISAEERAALDVSNWSVAAVGAEPIRPQTLDRFAEVFRSSGFQREAFYPCYGLAEATLLVAGGSKTAPPVIKRLDAHEPEQATSAVGCGHAWHGQELNIVDPQTSERVADGGTGEIWVNGESVAAGYWNRPEETAATFRAKLRGDSRAWLRTGDLGLVSDGELFVTSRLKDVIIIRGRNHYPHDIEATVQAAHPDFSSEGCAAVGVEIEGEERLVIVQEVDRQARGLDAARLQRSICQAVAERHELQVHDVVLVRPGGIAKTTSGKIRRSACKAAYQNGMLVRWQP